MHNSKSQFVAGNAGSIRRTKLLEHYLRYVADLLNLNPNLGSAAVKSSNVVIVVCRHSVHRLSSAVDVRVQHLLLLPKSRAGLFPN